MKYGTLIAAGALAGVVAFAPAASAVIQLPTVTTLTATPPTATTGQQVLLSAQVAGCPDPTVSVGMSFFDGTVNISPDPPGAVGIDAGGNASLPVTFDTPGTHTITAVFNATEGCAVSSATFDVIVTAASVPTPTTTTTPIPTPTVTQSNVVGVMVDSNQRNNNTNSASNVIDWHALLGIRDS